MSDNEMWEALQEGEKPEEEAGETGEALDVVATGSLVDGVMTIQGSAGPSQIMIIMDTADTRCYGVADQLVAALPSIVEQVMIELSRKQAEARG